MSTNNTQLPSTSESASSTTAIYICEACQRICKNLTGLKNHKRTCKSYKPTVENVVGNETRKVGNDDFKSLIHDTYNKMSTWRKNIFQLPKGNVGKRFVQELTNAINIWNNKSPERDVALKMFMVLPNLLLQRVNSKSSASDNRKVLERRLQLWQERKITELVGECLVIQSRLTETRKKDNRQIGETFQKLMIKGKVNSALRLLSDEQCNGILPLDDNTMNELNLKHPDASPLNEDLLLEGPCQYINPVIFESIDECAILKAALKTKGASGKSGWDADEWRRVLGSNIFGVAAVDLRKSLALK